MFVDKQPVGKPVRLGRFQTGLNGCKRVCKKPLVWLALQTAGLGKQTCTFIVGQQARVVSF